MFSKFSGNKNHSLTELQEGFRFDYDGISWQISEVHEYDWGDDEKSIEYKIVGDSQKAYLEIEEEEDELLCYFSIEIDKAEILPNFSPDDFRGEDILAELEYAGFRYHLDEIQEGFFNNTTTKEFSQKITNYIFLERNHFISIDQSNDGTLDISAGEEIKPESITNIIPPDYL